MTPFVTAGAGFLLAVLWFDLMFDLARVRRNGRGTGDPLATIAAYYRHVTTGARPMNRLVALVMLGTLAAICAQIARGDDPAWAAWASLGLALLAFGLAGGRTFAAARRLGAGAGDAPESERLAASILRDHLICLAAMSALLGIQLGA